MQDHYTPNQPNKPSESATDKSSTSVSPENNVAAAARLLFPRPAAGELIRLDAVYSDASQRDRRLFDAVSLAGRKEFCDKHFAATIVAGAASYQKGPDGKYQLYRLHALFVAINCNTAEEAAAGRHRLDGFALSPTMRADIRRGPRAWWTPHNPLDLTDAHQKELAECLLRRLAETFGGDRAMSKLNQLLVLPTISQANGTVGPFAVDDFIRVFTDASQLGRSAANGSDALYDLDEIIRTLRSFHRSGYFEIRALGHAKGIVAGIYSADSTEEIEKAAKAAASLSGYCKGVYFTINPIKPEVAEDQKRRVAYGKGLIFGLKPGEGIANADIAIRNWAPFDCDAERPKGETGLSATDEEHLAALNRMAAINIYLKECGIPGRLLADSGNGGHIAIPIDELPASSDLIQRLLHALNHPFSDEVVKLDTTVGNAARIWKLYGTRACKGANSPDRPHRLAKLLYVSDQPFVKATHAVLEAIIDANPPEKKETKAKKKPQAAANPITWTDIRPYIEARITKEKADADGRLLVEIEGCPFGPDHADDRAGYITIFDNGNVVVPGCHHDHCQGQGFLDFLKAAAPELIGKLSKPTPEQFKAWFTPSRDGSGDGTRLRISDEQLRGVQQAISGPHGPGWRASIVEWLISKYAYENHWAKDLSGQAYVYDHGVYRERAEERIRECGKRVIAENAWSTKLVNETIARITADAPLLWERPPLGVLNLKNGLFSLKTRDLKLHTPEFLSMVQLPVDYDPDAQCPKWDKQVAGTFPPDAVEAGVAWQILAWFMIPLTTNQKALLFAGPGGCGRSRFLNGLRTFLGGARNVSALTLEAIEHDRFAAAGLVGKLANICPDLPPTRLRGCSTFKRITDGKDPVRVEKKFYQSYDAQLFTRLAFSANIKPQSEDASDAFFQRWYVLEFTRVYRGAKDEIARSTIDAGLAESAELSGAFNRALAALPQVIKSGITVTPSMRAAHAEFQKLTDPLSVWLMQNTAEHPNAMVGRTELLGAFNAAQSAEGRYPMSATEFGRALNTLRPNIKDKQRTYKGNSGTWVYLGIGLILKDEEIEG